MITRPAQAYQAAPVVHHEHQAIDPEALPEALHRLYLALPGARRIGRGVSEAGKVERDGAPGGLRRGGQRVAPHVGRLRVAVQHEHDRPVGRTLFAVVDPLML